MKTHIAALALAIASILPSSAEAQTGSALLDWLPPTTNTDGTPLTDLAGYVIYRGTVPGSYPNSVTLSNQSSPTSYRWEGLANGTHYFVMTAVNTANGESVFSNVASKVIGGPTPPPTTLGNPTQAPTFTWITQPIPPSSPMTVTVSGLNVNVAFTLEIVGQGPVTLNLLGGLKIDACGLGPVGTPVPVTVPSVGVNNDGNSQNPVTFQGPLTTRCDADPTVPFGATVTRLGVTKPLVASGTTWAASFQ